MPIVNFNFLPDDFSRIVGDYIYYSSFGVGVATKESKANLVK